MRATPGVRAGAGAAMAGSPESGASLEVISLGSSEEADLRRKGRKEGPEAAGKAGPTGFVGIWNGCPTDGLAGA